MNIIKENLTNTITIKKSKFITYIFRINSVDEIKDIINDKRQEYQDATHVCYAYILNSNKKYSDDNEPSNTAGKPMLEVLEHKNLDYVLVLVVRYFGGIKLGSNGLIRAYADSVNKVTINNIKEQEIGYHIIIDEKYDKQDLIDYLLKDAILIKKEYTDKIYIETIIKKEILEKLSSINVKVIKEVII